MSQLLPGIINAKPEEVAPLLQLFAYIYPINQGAANFITQNIYPVTISKGTNLHKAGEICEYIYFIKSGAVRGFIKEGGKEKTTWISIENEMVASIYSFIMQMPSIENMEAVEDCQLLAMSHKNMHLLYELEPTANILARRIYEKYYADAEVRALTARFSSAEKKYDFFLQTYSHLANRISLTYIASFLGINLETLSRVRAKKKTFPKAGV